MFKFHSAALLSANWEGNYKELSSCYRKKYIGIIRERFPYLMHHSLTVLLLHGIYALTLSAEMCEYQIVQYKLKIERNSKGCDKYRIEYFIST